ncbi:uncharacterized protein YNL011C isoform X2 [Lotus japonicus]|uniref:uncharacterized protein YNL011C isoform X2 n=1 Tax=Lotus japonicus TaxID=34305 RepID=UPI00258A0991|nr:uncharacterized protein YNL011C isoform X2 [Lotus japonicus]
MVDTLLGPTFCNTFPRFLTSSSMAFFPSSHHRHHQHHRRCYSNPDTPHPQPALLVFSGGTAFNGVVEELKNFTTRVAHVLPVSDDGGSTAEIVRVLGGPAVGDIRSRCLRLSDQSTNEALAVRNLLGHRLPLDPLQAKSEWYSIVEGDHSLWKGVSKPYRETIRAFLVYFQSQILSRAEESFCFSNGSFALVISVEVAIVNEIVPHVFRCATPTIRARIFFQSLDAAIFLFSRVSDIPPESLVLPVISTNDRLTLGCELLDGTIIRGQNEISHPTSGSMELIKKESLSAPALPSKIKRVFYMSSEGKNLLHEVFPSANVAVLEQLNNVDCIVYGMGSLFTSICPSLVLLGIGEIISSRSCLKVLMLNGTCDRETNEFSASCFVTAITDALNRTYGDPCNRLQNLPSQYINTLLVPRDSEISVDVGCLASQGIFDVIVVDSLSDPKVGIIYDPKSLIRTLADLIDRYMKSQVNGLIDTR